MYLPKMYSKILSFIYIFDYLSVYLSEILYKYNIT